ncbi:MAG TPA: hypothetical protein VF546_19880 [Pyrinomonadaceae bacterium]|jgi:hypothetical protein
MMNNHEPLSAETPQETADRVAETYFGVTDEAARRRAVRQLLVAAVECFLIVPPLFQLRFGQVGPLGWGTTVFFSVYCLLAAVGLYFRPRTEYHTPVRLRGGWADRVGSFWLVACAFGPFFGWVVTSGVIPITHASWPWLYGLRVLLAAGLPVVTALPLTRYARGASAWVALPLLVCVTLLPVSSAMNVSLDLWEGPVTRAAQADGPTQLYLKHTERTLAADR